MHESEAYFRSNPSVVEWWNPEHSPGASVYSVGLVQAVEVIRRYSTGNKVLDAACGKGRVSNALLAAGFVVTSLDVSEDMLKSIPVAILSKTTIVVGSVNSMPFADAEYDAIICLEALVHFADLKTTFFEFNRVLRPGGILVVNFDNRCGVLRLVKDVANTVRGWTDPAWAQQCNSRRMRYRPLRKSDVYSALNSAGLTAFEEFATGIIMPFDICGTQVLSESTFLRFQAFCQWLDRVPLVRSLATYVFVAARKAGDP
jgi:SAM-dependent methyltransferase